MKPIALPSILTFKMSLSYSTMSFAAGGTSDGSLPSNDGSGALSLDVGFELGSLDGSLAMVLGSGARRVDGLDDGFALDLAVGSFLDGFELDDFVALEDVGLPLAFFLDVFGLLAKYFSTYVLM